MDIQVTCMQQTLLMGVHYFTHQPVSVAQKFRFLWLSESEQLGPFSHSIPVFSSSEHAACQGDTLEVLYSDKSSESSCTQL